jgi:thymidylate kinase
MVAPVKPVPPLNRPPDPPAGADALVRSVLAALDEAQVGWCLIRAAGRGGDIDVLVNAADLPRARAVMRSHGLLHLKAYGRGTHAFYLGRDGSTGAWIEFDLVTDLTFGRHFEIRTHTARACLARRQRVAGIWRLAPEDEFWAMLLHCVLDKRAFADRHARRLEHLASRASLASPVIDAVPPSISRTDLLEKVRAGHWRALVEAGPAVLMAWWRADPGTVGRAYARAAALRTLERPLQAWERRGASVALLGPDGCGKSTLAAGIQSTFGLPVRRVYMGLWPTSDAPRGPVTAAFGIARRPFVVWWRYLVAQRHRAMGRLVVFDRYVYDALLPPRGALIRLKRMYLRMLSRCCPAPELVILLDAPGEVMHARSGEYDAAHLEAERSHYARLATRLPRVVRVDADQPAERVLSVVTDHIWRRYLTRGRR